MKQPPEKSKPGEGAGKRPTPRETVRPFTLVKNFTFLSLAVIFAATLFLAMLITHRAKTVLMQKSEAYALLLANNLNHQIFLQFIIPTAMRFGRIQLREPEQFERLDKVVRGTLHGFNVSMVTIYGTDNRISYSFDTGLVGKIVPPGMEYTQALAGKSSSRLVQRGSFWSILLGSPEESKLRTFAPFFAEEPMAQVTERVLGVFEIVQDLSEDINTIFRFQLLIVGASAGVMLVLFMILRLYVKRGESILWQRAEERLKLEDELSEAERLAALGQMAAAVSHEIRNPLGIIRSSAQLLKKRVPESAGAGNFADVIVEESSRLNDIITDFLNFARPTLPRPVPCRVEEVLEKNIAFLTSRMEEDGVTVVKNYSPQLPEIMADPNLLYQAFLNILMNGMQAMPKGGAITIEILADSENVTLSFTDEGTGIDDAAIKRIWTPFFTTKERGTGLGLSVVKNIVEAHQGNVWLENAPARGASVWIQIPIQGKVHGNHSHR